MSGYKNTGKWWLIAALALMVLAGVYARLNYQVTPSIRVVESPADYQSGGPIVLFVRCNWSADCLTAERNFEKFSILEAARKTTPPRELLILEYSDPESSQSLEFLSWYQQQRDSIVPLGSGYGAVLWIRGGKIVSLLESTTTTSAEQLRKLTDEAFSTSTSIVD